MTQKYSESVSRPIDVLEESARTHWVKLRMGVTSVADSGLPYSLLWNSNHNCGIRIRDGIGAHRRILSSPLGFMLLQFNPAIALARGQMFQSKIIIIIN